MVDLDILRTAAVFADCTEQDLNRLVEIARIREFQDGQVVFSYRGEAKELMVLAEGEIQLEIPVSILGESRNIPFESHGLGGVIGWSALVPPYQFTFSGRARGSVRVVAFARTDLATWFASDPRFGFRVMANLLTTVRRRLDHTQAMWTYEIQRSLDERYR